VARPVALARQAFTPEQISRYHTTWEWQNVLTTGDASLYMFLHVSEFYPVTVVARSGPAVELEDAPDRRIGAVRTSGSSTATLDEYLAAPESRAQGMIVVCQGKVVFEQYPGMREEDSHITMSVAKTMPSLIVGLLEEEGKVDVQRTIGAYVPELESTAWHDVRVIDVLNMASGLDVLENEYTRDDVRSTFGRFLRAALNVPGPDGSVEAHRQIIRTAGKRREPGGIYEYSSINTQVAVLLAEAVERRPWAEIFRDRVWSRLYAEGDAQVMVTPDGIAMPFGFMAMRLRDLARFGVLYTPSWTRVARNRVVSLESVRRIQAGASDAARPMSPDGTARVDSSRHWDRVSADGSLFKGGLHGQGLYVSPDNDVVVAWFSTAPSTHLSQYAEAIARLYSS
jgi:CubicO group peptidase (beta-lactamase class C family)